MSRNESSKNESAQVLMRLKFTLLVLLDEMPLWYVHFNFPFKVAKLRVQVVCVLIKPWMWPARYFFDDGG